MNSRASKQASKANKLIQKLAPKDASQDQAKITPTQIVSSSRGSMDSNNSGQSQSRVVPNRILGKRPSTDMQP